MKTKKYIKTINKMIDEDYESFVKALIFIEFGSELDGKNIDILDSVYCKYMDSDLGAMLDISFLDWINEDKLN